MTLEDRSGESRRKVGIAATRGDDETSPSNRRARFRCRFSIGFDNPAHMWTSLKLYGDGNRAGPDSEDYMLLDYLVATNDTGRARLNFNTTKEFSPPGDGEQSSPRGKGVFRSMYLNSVIPTNAYLRGPDRYQYVKRIEPRLNYKIGSNIIAVGQANGPYRSLGQFLQLHANGVGLANVSDGQPSRRQL